MNEKAKQEIFEGINFIRTGYEKIIYSCSAWDKNNSATRIICNAYDIEEICEKLQEYCEGYFDSLEEKK